MSGVRTGVSASFLEDGSSWVHGVGGEPQITIFLVTVQGPQVEHALNALRALDPGRSVRVHPIVNVSPASRAFDEMRRRVQTPYFVQHDEDVELLPDAVVRFHEEVARWRKREFVALYRLIDPELGIGEPPTIQSLKLYRTDAVRAHPCHQEGAPIALSVDGNWHRAMLDDGLRAVDTKQVIGYHGRHRSEFDLLLRFCKIVASIQSPSVKTNSGHLCKLLRGLSRASSPNRLLRAALAHFTTFTTLDRARLVSAVEVPNRFVPHSSLQMYALAEEREVLTLPERSAYFELDAFLELFRLDPESAAGLPAVLSLLCVAAGSYAYSSDCYPHHIYKYFQRILNAEKYPRIIPDFDVEGMRLDEERDAYRASPEIAARCAALDRVRRGAGISRRPVRRDRQSTGGHAAVPGVGAASQDDTLLLFLQSGHGVPGKLVADLRARPIDGVHAHCFLLRAPLGDSAPPPEPDCAWYEGLFFDLSLVRDAIARHRFVVILDDRWEDGGAGPHVKEAVQLLRTTPDLHQVVFGSFEGPTQRRVIDGRPVAVLERGPRVDHDDNRRLRRKIQAVIRPEFRVSSGRTVDQDVPAYAKGGPDAPAFRLAPSALRVSSLLAGLDLTPSRALKLHPHGVHRLGRALDRSGFSSCALEASVRPVLDDPFKTRADEALTVVTGFIRIPGVRAPKRPLQAYDYVEASAPTLALPHPMVAYVSSDLVDHVRAAREAAGMLERTHIIEVDTGHLFLADEVDAVAACVRNNLPPYDDPRFILAVTARYRHLADALDRNLFGTELFAWVDFGASHIVRMPPGLRLDCPRLDQVRIGRIARYYSRTEEFGFDHKTLGGGLFAGHREILKVFLAEHERMFRRLMAAGYCVNDDKLLFLMFERCPRLFDIFFSGYASLASRLAGP